MKPAFQALNNGNGNLVLTADNLKFVCHKLGIKDNKDTLRRAARAFDLYASNKVHKVNSNTFWVASQYNRRRPYRVTLKQDATRAYCYCTCPDWRKNSGALSVPDVDFWCKHAIAAKIFLHQNGNGKPVFNECGSNEAKQLQDQFNRQLDFSNDNNKQATGGFSSKSLIYGFVTSYNHQQNPPQLDLSDPFQQSEQLDIDQIEGRLNSELAHRLSNGEYIISYKGIMTLAEKHSIEFTVSLHNDTNTVIAKAINRNNQRISGKPINGLVETAIELAKRNAARQLLPLIEIKAVEKQAQLETEFSWQKAEAKCAKLVGEANVDIIIYHLVNGGKLRQDNPSHYNRAEWLVIFNACQREASISIQYKGLF